MIAQEGIVEELVREVERFLHGAADDVELARHIWCLFELEAIFRARSARHGRRAVGERLELSSGSRSFLSRTFTSACPFPMRRRISPSIPKEATRTRVPGPSSLSLVAEVSRGCVSASTFEMSGDATDSSFAESVFSSSFRRVFCSLLAWRASATSSRSSRRVLSSSSSRSRRKLVKRSRRPRRSSSSSASMRARAAVAARRSLASRAC